MSEGLELEDAIRGLDPHGWNKCDMIQKCTFTRLAATNALIAEEILELSLGQLTPPEIILRATEIELKTNKCWEEIPDFLRPDVTDPWNSQSSSFRLLFLGMIRLGHLEHRFLLQRTLSKIAGPGLPDSHTNLLSVCDELFHFILQMVEHKDHFRDFQTDFVQILAVHGVPAAAILAVELLQQERNVSTAPSSITYPLHRSDLIQNLSVFVSCLGTVQTDCYGAQSCERGRKFLKTILDMILGSGAAARNGAEQLEVDELSDPMFGAPLLQTSDGDFTKWLESMEWEQDVWVNFN